MSFLSVDIPFLQCDTDSATLDSTGDTLDQLFTNLGRPKQREILLRNRGEVNILIGRTLATARWPLEPGDVIRLSLKDLTEMAAKAASSTATFDIFQII